jgi:hypothetical protein
MKCAYCGSSFVAEVKDQNKTVVCLHCGAETSKLIKYYNKKKSDFGKGYYYA